jgi:hypothetical protein
MRLQSCLTAVVLACMCAVLIHSAVAQDTSTPAERAQWVEITTKLESSPLDSDLDKQGESALNRISAAHDIHVPLCPAFLTDFNSMKYAYAHTITRQFMLSSTAFLVENPDKMSDRNAMNLSAVESALKTYTGILQQKPDARAKLLDDLLQKQKKGKMAEYVQKRCL